jgi:Uma2 family endonuclease
MNAPSQLRLDKAAFLHWLERQERKHEWKEGRVVQMPNVTKAHARIVSNFIYELRSRLDANRWSVTASDLGVEDEDFLRYPDVIVEPMDADDKGRRATNATILVEVLSPSSVAIDLTDKPQEYMRFASLEAYIVASQDEAICWVWQRTGEARSFPAKPAEIAGRDKTIDIAALGLPLPMTEIYRGITLAP